MERHVCPPEHKHGVRSTCYTAHRCRCDDCRAGCARRMQARRKAVAYGRYQPPMDVDSAPVVEHIKGLQAQGHGYRYIAAKAGVNARTVWKVGAGHAPVVRDWVAEAILAVGPNFDEHTDGRMVPVIGTRRRVQALAAQGWTFRELARRLGVHEDDVSQFLRNPKYVQARTHRMFADLYDALWDQEPPLRSASQRRAASLARARAQKLGWATPLAWDDESIDDESAIPFGHTRPRRPNAGILTRHDDDLVEAALRGEKSLLSPLERRDVVTILTRRAWSAARIAEWIGCNPKTVERIREELALPIADQSTIRSAA